MGHPPIEELLPKSGYSIYKLVRMAAARAIEIADGSPKLVGDVKSDKAPTLALEEIRAGKVVLKEVAHLFAMAPVKIKKGKKAEKASENEEAKV